MIQEYLARRLELCSLRLGNILVYPKLWGSRRHECDVRVKEQYMNEPRPYLNDKNFVKHV